MKQFIENQFSRNELWLSPFLKERIERTRIIIIGCGGNGVLFSIMISHLGFRDFVVCDNDLLEESNLNRFLIANKQHIGKFKVDVLKDYLDTLFQSVNVSIVKNAFPTIEIEQKISESDFVIGCVDNIYSRIEINLISRKYEKTLIDLGSGFRIDPSTNDVISAGGQIMVCRPKEACLLCVGFNQNILETNNYYLPNTLEIEPSSIILNTTICSLATEVLLREIAGKNDSANLFSYDRNSISVSRDRKESSSTCKICSNKSKHDVKRISPDEYCFTDTIKLPKTCKILK